ncbi:response regulator [Massilia sp. TS11]|uniref:response regulator n=1 Tax=Massilia sp. TS11 TaxID=2908003 RepID=UPI001EDAB80D|nr:response regulator [Massilia sp. TS11]MCG2586299.1 response regulator [Massilia sp. TS11]
MTPQSVMLLDDDPFTLALLQDMFSELGGYSVATESDARRALATLRAQAPDVLVCDLSMPDMDGIEFLQAAAESQYRGRVLLLSGVDAGVRRAAERLARAQGLRLVGAFCKPLGLEELKAALA